MPLAKNDVSVGVALTTAEKSIKAHDECDPSFCSGREAHTELIFKMDNNILIIVSTRSCRRQISDLQHSTVFSFWFLPIIKKKKNQQSNQTTKNPNKPAIKS